MHILFIDWYRYDMAKPLISDSIDGRDENTYHLIRRTCLTQVTTVNGFY